MLHRIKSLCNLRRPYLDELIFFVELRPVLSFIANIFIIPGIRAKHLFAKLIKRSVVPASSVSDSLIIQEMLNRHRNIPSRPNILLIVEASIPHCFRYRVRQKIEQLNSLGLEVRWTAWNADALASQELHFAHIVIFYRVPAFDSVKQLIMKAQALNKVVIYDTDDLIFDEVVMRENINVFSGLKKKELSDLITGAKLYYQAISLCSYTIGSTPTLCEQLEKIKPCFLHRNVLDKEIIDFIRSKQLPKLKRNFISIFYGSGTKTHNHDFELIKKPLLKILQTYKQVRLTIVGYLQLSDDFSPYLDRIEILTSEAYWQILQYTDINLAPLQSSVFADCKSEIKWMEAAALKIPSIVSVTQTYNEIIENGETAFLADTEEDWYKFLSELITNDKLRYDMAENAYQYVIENYHPDKASRNLMGILDSILLQEPDRYKKISGKKIKVVFVNVCFPPDGIGGATAIVKNQVEGLVNSFDDEFSVSVFTVDFKNTTRPYQLREYIYDNIHVTAVSVPQGIDLDWRYHDEHIHELFLRYIQFINADLIHFHSIQRLTASVMDVASKLKIPHVVTLHDSWWLCDRQFMINNNQLDCEQYQVDPLVCSKCLDDNNNSILRRLSLSEKLNKADKLLGVSDYQCSLYIKNGFESVSLHKNGIVKNEISANCPKTAGGSKNLENRGKLKLAYVGGICVHKGYYFLKSVIENLFLENCEFILVDLNLSNKEERQEKWGKNVIKFIGKIDFDKMIEFYQDIDVLLVPSMWRESFGLISREALVQGVWVVASNSGGLVEDIIPGINGDIFEKSNIEQFEKILLEIEANPEKYKNIGMARKGTEDIVSMKDNVDELVSIYRTLLK